MSLYQFLPILFPKGDIARLDIIEQMIKSRKGIIWKAIYVYLLVFYYMNKFLKRTLGFSLDSFSLFILLGVILLLEVIIFYIFKLAFSWVVYIWIVGLMVLVVGIVFINALSAFLFKKIIDDMYGLKLKEVDNKMLMDKIKKGELYVSDFLSDIRIPSGIKGKFLIEFVGKLQTYHEEERDSGEYSRRVKVIDKCVYLGIPIFYEDIDNNVLNKKLMLGKIADYIDKLPKSFESKDNKIIYSIRLRLLFDDFPDWEQEVKMNI